MKHRQFEVEPGRHAERLGLVQGALSACGKRGIVISYIRIYILDITSFKPCCLLITVGRQPFGCWKPQKSSHFFPSIWEVVHTPTFSVPTFIPESFLAPSSLALVPMPSWRCPWLFAVLVPHPWRCPGALNLRGFIDPT